MRSKLWVPVLVGLGSLSSSCTVPRSGSPPDTTIQVGQPEVFENADLQAQLDALRQQLVALNVIDQPSLIAALSNLQGASATQSGASVQVLQRGLPQVTTASGTSASTTTGSQPSSTTGSTGSTTTTGAALTPAAPASPLPAAPTLPSVALGSVGVLEQELQLSSQVVGYELLLTGSDFARYTTHGGAKDKLVIGFPITLNPKSANHDQAAEVEIKYFPPNPSQYNDPIEFTSQQAKDPRIRRVCDPSAFSDKNAHEACLEEEASPTIVNILPTERSYNSVVLSSTANTFGLGALIGTVSVGGSFGFGHQTQYLVAQQDTLAFQKGGPGPCKPTTIDVDNPLSCDPTSRGVSFLWQFRPVLGSHFVRPGLRRMYVQLAIPYARRPYPNYGGIVQIETRWRPFDSKKGVVTDAPPDTKEHLETRAVFGHPFIGPVLSGIFVDDLGSGNLLVSVRGDYLIGASVLLGSTTLSNGSPGFVASYDSLEFATTAQTVARTGASVVASGGVVTPLRAVSLCKYLDELGECDPAPNLETDRFEIRHLDVEPVSDSSSLVRVELKGPLDLANYTYHHYLRADHTAAGEGSRDHSVVGGSDDRKADDFPGDLTGEDLKAVNRLRVVINAGGKTYGFSDLPFQTVTRRDGGAVLSFLASNDSLNAAPELNVQRLFGDPALDSRLLDFVPPGRLQLTPFNHQAPAPVGDDKKKDEEKKQEEPKTSSPADPKGKAPAAAAVVTPAVPPLADAKKKPPPPPKAAPTETNCNSTKTVCDYLLVGARVYEAKILLFRPSCGGPITLSRPGEYGLNARKVTIPACYKQLVLEIPADESDAHPISEVIALTVPAATTSAAPKNFSKLVNQTPNTPNFTLSRSVQDVGERDGVVYLEVGVQKLKDQSATLTVSNADIVGAADGSGAALTVLPGNKVTVTQDTSVIFRLQNASASAVNVVAEGTTGGVSTGKVTFDGNFNITRSASAPKPPK
jgi:hypothetical protein